MAANPTCKYGYRMVRGRLSVTNTKHDNGWSRALFLLVKPEGEEELSNWTHKVDGASKKQLTLSKKLGMMIWLSRQMPTPSNGFRLEDASKMV